MSKVLELAKESESLAESRLERNGYDWSVDAAVQLRESAEELRRLAAVEAELEALKLAISQAEPVAYEFMPNGELLYLHELEREPDADYKPLYTLKGIK